tara:strand:+ start:305 stop:661 length:357 start_codon:yes stop_codon:yes gene_type:complete
MAWQIPLWNAAAVAGRAVLASPAGVAARSGAKRLAEKLINRKPLTAKQRLKRYYEESGKIMKEVKDYEKTMFPKIAKEAKKDALAYKTFRNKILKSSTYSGMTKNKYPKYYKPKSGDK